MDLNKDFKINIRFEKNSAIGELSIEFGGNHNSMLYSIGRLFLRQKQILSIVEGAIHISDKYPIDRDLLGDCGECTFIIENNNNELSCCMSGTMPEISILLAVTMSMDIHKDLKNVFYEVVEIYKGYEACNKDSSAFTKPNPEMLEFFKNLKGKLGSDFVGLNEQQRAQVIESLAQGKSPIQILHDAGLGKEVMEAYKLFEKEFGAPERNRKDMEEIIQDYKKKNSG